VVLGVIEPSSIIVVFLAHLVQWLSLTHSLTICVFVCVKSCQNPVRHYPNAPIAD
jgi:hypothetical protein